MTSHPDADGFIRSILANLADPTPRLVFADWLDDTGRPGDAAWAEYIRLRADGNGWRAVDAARRITARLTLSAVGFPARAGHIFDLLPPTRVSLRLGGLPVPSAMFELVPESVARENLLVPLAVLDGTAFPDTALLVAAWPPDNVLARDLRWMLNRELIAVGADTDELIELINLGYGGPEQTLAIDTPTLFLPEYADSDVELHRRHAD